MKQKALDAVAGPRHYLVVFGSHLEPGDDDRIAMRVRSKNPRDALGAAELVVKEQKGAEWLEAFYQVGLTPDISVTEPPKDEPAVVRDAATKEHEVAGDDKLYKVHFFCGSQAITVDAWAVSGEEAATLKGHVDSSGMMAAQAVNPECPDDDNWGPGVVRIPVELVVGYGDMSPEQRRNAESAIGITRIAAGPALDLGSADTK